MLAGHVLMDRLTRLVPNHSHWGAFLAEVQNGRFVGVRPFPRDPDPSPLIEMMPAAVHSTTRIVQPMVREGFTARSRGNGEGRGRERFVPVSWERALDLAAGELDRVRRSHGHDAIMGGLAGLGVSRPLSRGARSGSPLPVRFRRFRRSNVQLQLWGGAHLPAARAWLGAGGHGPAHVVVVDRLSRAAPRAVRRR
jgi:hypothetical protein